MRVATGQRNAAVRHRWIGHPRIPRRPDQVTEEADAGTVRCDSPCGERRGFVIAMRIERRGGQQDGGPNLVHHGSDGAGQCAVPAFDDVRSRVRKAEPCEVALRAAKDGNGTGQFRAPKLRQNRRRMAARRGV